MTSDHPKKGEPMGALDVALMFIAPFLIVAFLTALLGVVIAGVVFAVHCGWEMAS